jgi:hypothetical protein
MFNELYRLGDAVKALSDTPQTVKVAAAKNADKNALMIVNYDGEDETVEIELDGLIDGELEIRLTDATHTDERIALYRAETKKINLTLPMKKDSFVYIGSKLD